MKNNSLLLLVACIFLFYGCATNNVPRKPSECDPAIIIPGECVAPSGIGFNNSFRLTGDYDGHLGLMVDFSLNTSLQTTIISETAYQLMPGANIFETFGSDARQVKTAFKNIYDEYRSILGSNPVNGAISTVYYAGGIVITANKEFAGIPAGENLAPLLRVFPECLEQYTPIPTIDAPEGYLPLPMTTPIKFRVDDFDVTEEIVVFQVEIPVKIGMMLTLLRDRLSDPDAKMQFNDVVFTSSFMTPRGLRQE